MSEKDFFREATLRICGNLDIEKALFSCFQYLQQKMPVEWMSLQLYEERLKAMRTVAIATPEQAKEVNLLTPLSPVARQQIEKRMRLKISGARLIILDNETESYYRDMLSYHGVNGKSVIVMPLESEGRYIGSLALISGVSETFSQEHAGLISSLKEPFVIAMSNTLRYHEVMKLRDLLADDNRYLHRELRRITGDDIIGVNFGLREVMEKVHQVAAQDSPVLLLGETGVGKDVIASAIHYSSRRKDGPFIKVNCGAIPESLIDSELFGHEKGAFTGAVSQKRGKFERADKGTIFLDEIGELPLQVQVRLLRVLQHKEIERVGGSKTIQLDIRFIAATNRDLEMMVENNQFREDLWFRLNVFPIRIPPLRDRRSDIPALVEYFINKKVKELKLPGIPDLSPEAMDILMNYDWKGNVRELENVVERALILNPQGPLAFDYINQNHVQSELSIPARTGKWESLDMMTSRYIKRVLSSTGGRINGKNGAAEILGVNPNTLRNRMKKLGITFGRINK
ncbi:MAG: sigma 54-interacting transcriptional regulator [Bacteroidales bacterium]|nr:sigma 54-interacting transcriptional regulator [Bacteroidales bacterium]